MDHEAKALEMNKQFEATANQIAEIFEDADENIIEVIRNKSLVITEWISEYLKEAELCRVSQLKTFSLEENRLLVMKNQYAKIIQRIQTNTHPSNYYLHRDLGRWDRHKCNPKRIQVKWIDLIHEPPSQLKHRFALVFTTLPTIQRPLDSIREHAHKQGHRGDQPGNFMNPHDLAIHPRTGNVYVVDCDNHRIQILSPELEFIDYFSLKDKTPWPELLAIEFSIDGSTLVITGADESGCTWIVGQDGELLHKLTQPEPVEEGTSGPTGYFVARDVEDHFYLSSCSQRRILKIDLDGNLLCSIGDNDSPHPIGEVYGLAVVGDELFAVGDGNFSVNVYSLAGDFLRSHDIEPSCYGNGMASGVDGGFIVTDYWHGKIFFYGPDATLIKKIECPGAAGCRFASDGRLYVALSREDSVCYY
eukprot:TRINITY_DN7050_c0_g1_i1.p1 TRINITY_DN7050_c0_g1~~TRINITY_DN7050_c0_g1_i1.p1  ORF type:complete len:418 (+),score=88.08 TRINITY_DN7050_c0_g1_i1:87-1340(+)